MAEWTQCPSCQLKHVARPDGLCPRCRHPIAVGWGAGPAAPVPAPAAVAASTTLAPPAPGLPPASPPPPGAGLPAVTFPVGMAAAPYAFTVGRFIGGVFGTWGRVAGWIVPVALVAYSPGAFALYRLYARMPTGGPPADPLALFRPLAGFLILLVLITPLERVAIARAGVRRLRQEPVGLADMLGTAFRFFFPTVALLFLVGLAVMGTACTLFIVPAILLTAWAASLPAMITEGIGPIEALKRSWALTRGLRWQVFAGFLVVTLIVVAVSCVLQGALTAVVVAAAVGVAREDPHRMMGAMSVVQATNVLLQGVYDTVLTTATAVAYHQLRVAAEGPVAQHLGQVFE